MKDNVEGKKSVCGSEAAAEAEGIICSFNAFSAIIVTTVWLGNVTSGLVQLKSSPLLLSVNSHFGHRLSE